ncbi:MAG: class II fructose-bisphosphatase [Actinomycetota bacterium]|nr:class II fructose-bisphosphatase [Actinomycetota bacterium]
MAVSDSETVTLGSGADRNLGMELVRVTEAAALAAARWMGRGDKEGADKAAVDAMRLMISHVDMDGIVVIGEGEKDDAPMLYNGERVGTGEPPEVDVAVDPIEGTTMTSKGQPGALSVIAVANRGAMFDPGPCFYMDKIATGPEAADLIDLEAPVADNIKAVARGKGVDVDDVTVIIMDKPRHKDLIEEIRRAGARIRLISDGDVSAGISAAKAGTGVDLLVGTGGTPEGVITAAALKCLGGMIQGRLNPQSEEERRNVLDAGYDLTRVVTMDELVQGDCFFAATGITGGELLDAVRYRRDGATTQSIVMRSKTGTVRTITAEHNWKKLMAFSEIHYD